MVQTTKFLIMKPSRLPFWSLLGPNTHLRTLFSNTSNLHENYRNYFYVEKPEAEIWILKKVFPLGNQVDIISDYK